MRPLSASEAISPALDRTRDFLARPFRLSTFLKLAAIAFFAEIGGGFNFNFPGHSGGIHQLPPAFLAFILAFAVVLGLISLILGLVLFYISSRLQLVLVELVATRQSFVAPVWRRVSQATWRWIGLKVLFFLAALLLMLVLALPAILYFVSHGSAPSFDTFFHLHLAEIILIFAVAFLALLVTAAAYMLLRDLLLPFIVLEDLSISETMRRLRSLLVSEPGAVALFLLLRLLLIIVFAIAGEILIVVVALLSLIPFGLAGGGLWFALHNAGSPGTAALIACAVIGGLIFLCWLVVLGISILGSVFTFSQAYSLYFLGGRYPLLGDLLDRSNPPPAYAVAPPFPSLYQPPQPPPQAG